MVWYLTLDRLSNTHNSYLCLQANLIVLWKAVFDTDFVCMCVVHSSVKSICFWGLSCRWHLPIISLDLTFASFRRYTYGNMTMFVHILWWSTSWLHWNCILVVTSLVYGSVVVVHTFFHPYLWNTGSVLAHVRSDVPVESRNVSCVAMYVKEESPKNLCKLCAVNLCICQAVCWGWGWLFWTFIVNSAIKMYVFIYNAYLKKYNNKSVNFENRTVNCPSLKFVHKSIYCWFKRKWNTVKPTS